MYNLQSILCVWVIFMLQQCAGRVEIKKPYHPYYMKAGETLQLLCNSTERRDLQWVHQVPGADWKQAIINPRSNPAHRDEFVIRNTFEEPSGNVESELYRRNIELNERGMYKCQDEEAKNTYSVWVTVLYFRSENVTAKKDEPVSMYCKISGFDQNPPAFEYAWYYDELFIPRDHPRYYMTRLNETTGISLTIKQPLKKDIGRYNCVFKFALNIGTKEMTHSAFLSGDSLPISHAVSLMSSSLLSVILATITLAAGYV